MPALSGKCNRWQYTKTITGYVFDQLVSVSGLG